MTPEQRAVEAFHRATGATIGDVPGIRDAELRKDLILEEAHEFAQALFWQPDGKPNMVAAIDALCDLLYVVYGTAVTFGVDLEPFFQEVHRSNMTKVGGPVREDGKRLKPEGYEPPNLAPILKTQKIMRIVDEVDRIYETLLPGRYDGIECQGGCGLSFTSWKELREHLDLVPDPQYQGARHLLSRTHIGAQAERVWQCPRCDLLFFHDDPLDDHIHYDHDDGEYAL